MRDLQQPRGRGSRRSRARRCAEDPAPADHRACDRRFQPLGCEIGDRHRPPPQQLIQPRSAEAAKRATGGHQIPQLAGTGLVERRRHLPKKAADRARNRDRGLGELRPSRGVRCRPLRQRLHALQHLAPQHEGPAVAGRCEHADGGTREVQALLLEIELGDDVGAQGSRVRERRNAEARCELVGHRRAADLVAPLEHQGLATRARKIGRGDQAVVAAADDDGTAHLIFPLRTASAALRPGAPMMPPPGCVADPQSSEAVDRRAVVGPAWHRTQEEELFERQLALEDVALGERPRALEIERRHHLTVQDDVFQVRRVFRQRVDDGVAERLALIVPRAFGQRVRRVLDEARHHVLAGRRHRRIGQRRNHHVHVRAPRKPPVLRIVVGALHVVDAGRDRDRAAQMRSGAGKRREVRQRVEREVHLSGRAAESIALHPLDELVRQQLLSNHRQERAPRVDARRDQIGLDLVAVLEHHAARAVLAHDNARDRRLGADLDAGLPRGGRNRFGDGAGAAAREAPRAKRAVDLAHVVVQQYVGRARRAHAQERADDAARRHRRLQHVGLEPLIQEIDRAHRHELDLVEAVFGRQVAEAAAEEQQPRQIAWVQRPRIGRRHVEDWLDEARHLDHRERVLVVGFRVDARMPRDLAARLRVIVHAPQVIAARHRRERAVERQDLETVARQIELANDLGPEQRHDVGADREAEARKDFLGHGRAAEHVPAFEDDDAAPRAREIRGVHEPVVSAADDDGVVSLWHCRRPAEILSGTFALIAHLSRCRNARPRSAIARNPQFGIFSPHARRHGLSSAHVRALREPELPRVVGVLHRQRLRGAPRARVRGDSQRRGADRRVAAVQVPDHRARFDAAGRSHRHARRHEDVRRPGDLHALVRRARQGDRRRHGVAPARAGVALDGRGSEPALVPAERARARRLGRGHLGTGRGAGRAGADVSAAAAPGRRAPTSTR